jgi:prevent-host-death family protein
VAKKKGTPGVTPDFESATVFSRGQAARVFQEVKDQDKVLIVNKQNRPQTVIISYERYRRLKEEGADI